MRPTHTTAFHPGLLCIPGSRMFMSACGPAACWCSVDRLFSVYSMLVPRVYWIDSTAMKALSGTAWRIFCTGHRCMARSVL